MVHMLFYDDREFLSCVIFLVPVQPGNSLCLVILLSFTCIKEMF
uniref:Uncharacterized protein n=1 Tax=Arundo donax TaxID=35708 RepID=A0A0A9H8D4_ARUDO